MLDKKDYAELSELDKQKAREIIFTEEKDMLLVAQVVSLTMFILGSAMVVINAIEGNKAMVIVSLIYGPLFLISFIITTLTKRTKFFFDSWIYPEFFDGVCLSYNRRPTGIRNLLDVYNHFFYILHE